MKRKYTVIILFRCFTVRGRREWKKLNLQQGLSGRDNSACPKAKGKKEIQTHGEGGKGKEYRKGGSEIESMY